MGLSEVLKTPRMTLVSETLRHYKRLGASLEDGPLIGLSLSRILEADLKLFIQLHSTGTFSNEGCLSLCFVCTALRLCSVA